MLVCIFRRVKLGDNALANGAQTNKTRSHNHPALRPPQPRYACRCFPCRRPASRPAALVELVDGGKAAGAAGRNWRSPVAGGGGGEGDVWLGQMGPGGRGGRRLADNRGPERTGPSARDPQGVAGSCSWRAISGRRFVCPEGDFRAQICPPGRYFLS